MTKEQLYQNVYELDSNFAAAYHGLANMTEERIPSIVVNRISMSAQKTFILESI